MRIARSEFVTRSRRRDTAVFLSILGLMVLFSPALRVYYQVTVVEVSVERVTSDGQRATLTTPPEFDRPGNGDWRGNILLARLEPRIRSYMEQSDWGRDAPPGTRFEWTVRWSDNSSKLDHVDRVVWEKSHGDASNAR